MILTIKNFPLAFFFPPLVFKEQFLRPLCNNLFYSPGIASQSSDLVDSCER